MTKEQAIETIWEYMHLHHTLQKSDAILVLGNRDLRVAECASKLWLEGWAPYLVCSGSGSIHNAKPGREEFVGTTEAEVFASVALRMGVPESALMIENRSQNTGQNFEFAIDALRERGIQTESVILVQKPYMERRTYATGKVWLPHIQMIVTSPPIPLSEYPNESNSVDEHWIHGMVGDLQRIKEYPAKGFQISQEIPDNVWEAFQYLVALGYTNRLIV